MQEKNTVLNDYVGQISENIDRFLTKEINIGRI